MRLEDLGEAAARAVRRDQPFTIAAVSDFLRGRSYSQHLLEGVALALGLDIPPVSSGDAQIQAWTELGMRMQRFAPEQFERELERLSEYVDALEKFELRKP